MVIALDSKETISDLSVLIKLAYDKTILTAMKANEAVTNTKYEKEVKAGYAEPIQAILRKGLADERRHKALIDTTLDKL